MDEKNMDFKHLDVTPLATDHYYINSNKCSNNKNYAHIMKEWKILEKNLPDAIYVQAYENRIDLLQAVIIGPAGTPYHDGLFFFDILLPSDYPNSPPQVYYHSHGHRLNPNLYDNGYVCLSLINTWEGNKCEKWSNESTILQVLVSIQGLVLNERPLFNEPSYMRYADSKESKWIDASAAYNETTFILSCKTMVKIMKKPPMDYARFVVQHFREQGPAILGAIARYEQGCVVGQLQTSTSSSTMVSSKFKKSLPGIRLMMEHALSSMKSESDEVGASTSETMVKGEAVSEAAVKDEVVSEMAVKDEAVAETTVKVGCWDRVIGFANKICGTKG